MSGGSLILAAVDGAYVSLRATGSASGGPGRRDDYYMTFELALVADGEETIVALEMIEPYRGDTTGFFADIAREGWTGTEAWESEYAEAAIVARSEGTGDVDLDLTLRWDSYEASLTRTMRVRQTELARFAREIVRVLRVDEVRRFVLVRPTPNPKKRRR
jgi:Family of unknown function (DUF6228)